MLRPTYATAINWLAGNDDNEWLKDAKPMASVPAALVIDLFGVPEKKLVKDLRRALVERHLNRVTFRPIS